MTETPTIEQPDRMLWLRDLPAALGVADTTVRRWRAYGRPNGLPFPQPDINESPRVCGWRLSTLHAAGIKLP